jgi:hypothetical protein
MFAKPMVVLDPSVVGNKDLFQIDEKALQETDRVY